jgi:plasmid stabilization system protein ParE
MAEIRWTDEAVTWLEDIRDYISHESPRGAARVVSGIYDRVQILSHFPEIGYKHHSERAGHIRILLYGRYRIAYRWKREQSAVEIIGVFHGSLDFDQYL